MDELAELIAPDCPWKATWLGPGRGYDGVGLDGALAYKQLVGKTLEVDMSKLKVQKRGV